MTMRELAKLANVSVSTVSKAFSGADDVREDTKNYIFEVAKKYGCFGKFYKDKFSKKVIAIICSELISNYYSSFVEKLQNYIESNGGIAVISADHFNRTKQAELIEYYASYLKVDGIIVFDLKSTIKKGYDIPIVALFSSVDENIDLVKLNIHNALKESIELLYGLGHRNVAFIGESFTKLRAKHFVELVSKYDGMTSYVYESNYRFEKAGQDGVEQILKEKVDCTAFFCAYDNIAIGSIKQLKKIGFTVPDDYSVIGINNITTAEYMQTSLTTIDSNSDEICAIAWDLLQKKQSNKYYSSNKEVIIKCRLIVRESVGKASR